jgi:predicted Zn-dependent protease
MGQRMAMKFSRTQEEAADSLAVKYLDKMDYSPTGLLEIMQYFDREELSYQGQIDEYALTHPISKKRINFIKSTIKKTHYDNEKIDKNLTPRLELITAKLQAFLSDPNQILRYYSGQNNPRANYARSVAYFKKGKINDSLNEIDSLIKNNPANGYLWELKGQVLFESGLVKDSIIAYKKAVELEKENPTLARISLASAVIALNSGDKELINYAINNLILAAKTEDNDPNIYKQLATAYNQNGDSGHAYLALSEFNLLSGDKEKTLKYAKLAKENLDKNDKSSLIRAEDIIATTKSDKDKKKSEK